MSVSLEYKKMKRTGFLPAFFWGGVTSSAVPVLNMAVRSELYVGAEGDPIQILFGANWQMMAMFNVLLVTAGACLMYHTEYADNALQRMCTLPVKESGLYFGKAVLMVFMCALILVIETAGISFCLSRWFGASAGLWTELFKSFGYELFLTLPTALCALFIASMCRNMWVSLGTGVVCVFAATMIPAKDFVLSLFPFALPFQVFAGTEKYTVYKYMAAALTEIIMLAMAEILFLKVRRSVE